MISFLSSRSTRILTAVLLLQAAAFYGMGRPEPVRATKPLSSFPSQIGRWKMVQEGTIEKEVMDVLKADDAITRWYGNQEEKAIAALFVAYFATQRTGKAPHSPKNCLPGAGWLPLVNDRIHVPVAGRSEPVEANRYIVARGNEKSLVLYWYQTFNRTIASEYEAKFYTALDAIRYNRSDTAVVKVTIPVQDGNEQRATELAVKFVQSFFDQLTPYFPA
jgi:EpsI family protein